MRIIAPEQEGISRYDVWKHKLAGKNPVIKIHISLGGFR